mmetsp:Transcript_9476/g.17183  ORF Transcript_9476/g.17183 Transcript_9476/m.17183 type:complete len:231 (+) Transcript_9476:1677-2369(+)
MQIPCTTCLHHGCICCVGTGQETALGRTGGSKVFVVDRTEIAVLPRACQEGVIGGSIVSGIERDGALGHEGLGFGAVVVVEVLWPNDLRGGGVVRVARVQRPVQNHALGAQALGRQSFAFKGTVSPRHHHDALSRRVLLAMAGHFLTQERIVRRRPQRMPRGILERAHGRPHPKRRLCCQQRHLQIRRTTNAHINGRRRQHRLHSPMHQAQTHQAHRPHPQACPSSTRHD